jgi:hypothetical protein
MDVCRPNTHDSTAARLAGSLFDGYGSFYAWRFS